MLKGIDVGTGGAAEAEVGRKEFQGHKCGPATAAEMALERSRGHGGPHRQPKLCYPAIIERGPSRVLGNDLTKAFRDRQVVPVGTSSKHCLQGKF